MIYPFVVSFALGIVLAQIFNFDFSVALLFLLVSLATFLVSRFTKIFLVIGLGLTFGILRISLVDSSPDPLLTQSVGQQISFEALVTAEPDIRDVSARYIVNLSASKSLVMLVTDRFPLWRYGDQIRVTGWLDSPKNFLNENGEEFDYVSYLAKNKIHFVIYSPDITPASSGSTGLRGTRKIVSALYSIKNIFIEKISNVVPEPNSSFLASLIFGAKQTLGQELLDDFKKVGLIHIVVLSGYNITIIAAGVFYVTTFFGKRKLGFAISVVVIVLFALMVGLGATIIRACIMSLIAILARFLGRPILALRSLFVAGLFMLVWNPLILLYDPSFQLSFMATLGLILFSPFIYGLISKHKIRKYIPEKLGLREIVSSTLAVQFFVLPLLIKMAGFVSLISFLINPIVLPIVPLAMGLGALTGTLGIIPLVGFIFSWPFGALSYFVTQIIITLTEFCANIPYATLQTGSVPAWLILAWYLGYAILYWKLKSPHPPYGHPPLD